MSEAAPEFTVVAALLALVSDPKAAAKRLAELQRQIEAAAKAQAKLDADRETHAATAAALEAREAALVTREEACAYAEAEYFKQLGPEQYPLDGNLGPGSRSHSGLTRERHHE